MKRVFTTLFILAIAGMLCLGTVWGADVKGNRDLLRSMTPNELKAARSAGNSTQAIQAGANKTLAAMVYVNADWATATGDPDLGGPATMMGVDAFATIQEGIDAVDAGGTVNVYPGTYSETAANRYLYDAVGPYQFGLFFGQAKPGITVRGVDGAGAPITVASNAVALVTTNATNSFGTSGFFVEADNITITGLKILDNVAGNNKTIEVIGDNATIKNCWMAVTFGGSFYLNDWRYDGVNNVSYVKSYTIEGNRLDEGGSVDIASGAGVTGPVSGRIIRNNTFNIPVGTYWAMISFSGTVPEVGWFVYSVGGAAITGNTFNGGDEHIIRARGLYDNSQFDWASYWNNNTFSRKVAFGTNPPSVLGTFSYVSYGSTFPNVRHIAGFVQQDAEYAQAGDKVILGAGTYPVPAVVTLNKANVTVQGSGSAATILQVSGLGERLNIAATGVTVKDLAIQKTDKAGLQNIIYVGASNFTLKNTVISGQFVIGDGDVSRAIVTTGGLTGLLFEGNTFHSLRQPAYVSGPTTGLIKNNLTYGTKGWVLEGGDMTFEGNTWGSGAQTNVYDIAILSMAPLTAYTDIVAMSNANNEAVIEDQRVSPAVLSVAYVNGATSFSGDMGGTFHPYATIAPAITRVVTGGTIHVAAGTYAEVLNLNKENVKLLGAGTASTIVDITGLTSAGNGAGVDVVATGVAIKQMTVQGSSTVARYGIQFSNAAVMSGSLENVKVQNCYRTGINMNGAKNITLTTVSALNNGGNGIQMSDALNITLNGITTAGNAWGGVGIFVWGRYYPRGTSGIVFQGTNSFGESATGQGALYLESADWVNPTVPGTITFSTSGSDNAQVTLTAAAFGFAVSGPQESEITNSTVYTLTRTRFYQTLDQAKAFAGAAGIAAHMLPTDRYLYNVTTFAGPRTFRVYDFPGDLMSIKAAVAAASDGDVITVDPGTYVEGPQVVVNSNVSVVGADKNTVIITPSVNTGNSGDARGWFLVNAGKTFNLSGVTLDGAGKLVNIGILSKGPGTITNNIIRNCGYEPSTAYTGRGIAFYDVNMTVSNNTLSNIGRIGIYMYGAGVTNGVVTGNTFTGKGAGNWLDYGIEVEGAAHAVITNNTVTNCTGVATLDGSTSAGVLATTYFTPGTQVNATNNTFTNNTAGLAIGYDGTDVTAATISGNNFTGCEYGVTSSAPVVDARNNWWGNGSGPSGGVADPTTATLANGTGALVSEHVRFDPWTGKAEIVNVPAPGTYSWPQSDVSMVFGTVPPGGGTVTVQRLAGTPPNPPYPAPPAGATYIPLWLTLSSTMPNYTFSVTITIDVSDVAGFGPASQIMYLNSISNTWVPVGGTYNDVAKTFTFTTTHFTPYAFVNTPATAFNLYVSSSTAAVAGGIYPNNTWAMPSPLPANYPNPPRATDDWGYTGTQTFDVYLVPQAGMSFGAADLTLEWDATMLDFSAVSFNGSIFGAGNVLFATSDRLGTTNRVRINASLTSPNNVTTMAGNYIAKLTLRMLKPGHSAITVIASDLRQYVGAGAPLGLYVTPYQGDVRAYLGDVSSTSTDAMADGKIDIADLNSWAFSYWSGVSGYANGMTYYKAKFDIGPTADHYVFSMPQVDGKIDFEDLILFSISFGLSANHQLPKVAAEQAEPVTVAIGDVKIGGGETRVPVMLEGGVADLRGLSLSFNGSHGKLLGVEKGQLLSGYATPVPVMSCERDGKVYVDFAIAGAKIEALQTAGEVLVLRFEGKASLNVTSADARTSTNTVLATKLRATVQSELPTEFAMQQNYPNPFNPSTTVSYALPAVSEVRIAVYNVLGEQVAMLANGIQEAGFYTVQWNGVDSRGQHVTSGVYFLTMHAGEFTAMKKMMMVK